MKTVIVLLLLGSVAFSQEPPPKSDKLTRAQPSRLSKPGDRIFFWRESTGSFAGEGAMPTQGKAGMMEPERAPKLSKRGDRVFFWRESTGNSGGEGAMPTQGKAGVIEPERAIEFARGWIAAWNAQDMAKIMSHYSDDFTMSSPLIVQRLGKADGSLKGKEALRQYLQSALEQQPTLRFEMIDVLAGVGQITVYYRHVGGRVVAETFSFDAQGKVIEANAQWSVTGLE